MVSVEPATTLRRKGRVLLDSAASPGPRLRQSSARLHNSKAGNSDPPVSKYSNVSDY
jgi:hypothetical protein